MEDQERRMTLYERATELIEAYPTINDKYLKMETELELLDVLQEIYKNKLIQKQDFEACRRKYGTIHYGGRDLALIQKEVEFDRKSLLAKTYAVDRRGKKYVVLLGYPAVYRLGD